MKPHPLFLLLALLAAPLRAQTEAPPPGRDDLLAEIASWRQGQLVHVVPPDPLTAELEPLLDKIQGRIKAAPGPDELALAGNDLKSWEHDLVAKKFAVMKREGLTRGSVNHFSQDQRDQVRGFALRTDAIASARLKETSAQLFDGGGSDAAAVGTDEGARRGTTAAAGSAAAAGLHINPAPLPPPTAKPMSLASLEDYFDRSGISEAVVKSVEKIKNEVAGYGHLLSGFAGSCYYGVKWMLIKTHVLPPEVEAPEEIGKIGIGSGNAYEMSAALKRNPKLQAKLHVRSLDLTTVKDADAGRIPERTMLVFDRGCAGFSDESGHIEYTLLADKLKDLPASAFHRVGRRHGVYKPSVEANEVLACSDGCMVHSMAYLRTYGRKRCLNAYVPVSDAPTQLASSETPAAGF